MFCKICGNEVNDNAVICPKCGCPIDEQQYNNKIVKSSNNKQASYSGLQLTTAIILYIVAFIIFIFRIISLVRYFEIGYIYDLLLYVVPTCHFATVCLTKRKVVNIVFSGGYFLQALYFLITMFFYSFSIHTIYSLAMLSLYIILGVYFLITGIKKK